MDQFFHDIVQSVREPLVVLGADLRVLSANASFYRLFRLPPAEVEGRDFFSVDRRWDIPALRMLISEVLTLNRQFEDFEVILVTEAGTRSFLLNARQIARESNRALVLLAIEDVTPRLAFERERQQLLNRLQATNRELQEFAQVASHDLQEPLRKIQAFGDRLRTDTCDVISPEARGYLDRMLAASVRMQTLINDLLILSRLDTRTPDFTSVDLHSIATDVIADLEARIQQSGASIQLPARLPVIQADPLQMRQLLQNLIGNALKYRRPDTLTRICITSRTLPDTGSSNGGARLELRVEDNGIGFDEKYLDRIF
jgi:PAS domain S-box-containing protein